MLVLCYTILCIKKNVSLTNAADDVNGHLDLGLYDLDQYEYVHNRQSQEFVVGQHFRQNIVHLLFTE